MALVTATSSANTAEAIKQWSEGLAQAEKALPRSEDFWYLGSAIAMMLSARAVSEFPTDPEVQAIFQGIRAHRRQ